MYANIMTAIWSLMHGKDRCTCLYFTIAPELSAKMFREDFLKPQTQPLDYVSIDIESDGVVETVINAVNLVKYHPRFSFDMAYWSLHLDAKKRRFACRDLNVPVPWRENSPTGLRNFPIGRCCWRGAKIFPWKPDNDLVAGSENPVNSPVAGTVVGHPIIWKWFYTSQVVGNGMFEPSTVWGMNWTTRWRYMIDYFHKPWTKDPLKTKKK